MALEFGRIFAPALAVIIDVGFFLLVASLNLVERITAVTAEENA